MILHDRRTFIRNATAGIAGIGLADMANDFVRDAYAQAGKTKVAVVRNERAITDRNAVNALETRKMIDKALEIITGATDPKQAWAALGVTSADVVGIKVNCNTWTILLATHAELVYALAESLSEVVKPNNIIIYERDTSELTRSGYKANTGGSGIRCFGSNQGGGFARDGITKIVAETCTKLINIPSLKAVEGEFAGSLFLKNHIGSIPTSQMANCHGNAVFCTDVCESPAIKDKTVLALCDGLRGTYRRGVPWYWGGIVASRDQVAAEYVSLQVINEKRSAEKERPFAIPGYVIEAGKRGLGTSDPGRIETVKITL